MFANLPALVGLLVLFFTSWNMVCLYANYRRAKKIGLHVLVSPANAANPIWQFILAPVVYPWAKWLEWDAIICSVFTWQNEYRYKMHEKYGMVFVVVNPATITVLVADGMGVKNIFADYKSFSKPHKFYQFFERYGVNVISVNGPRWQQHRKLTTPPFNEKNNQLVWGASLQQTDLMAQKFIEASPVTTTRQIVLNLALNVLCKAGLGISDNFANQPDQGQLSYSRCLVETGEGLFKGNLPRTFWTKEYAEADRLLPIYLNSTIQNERQNVELGIKEDDGSLMSVLIRESSKAGKDGLTHSEIRGNLWVYVLAGHDTSANTITNAIYLMAAYPHIQDWVREEVKQVFPDGIRFEDWDYKKFPELKRCLAVMHEVLRLYGPLDSIPRWVEEETSLDLVVRPGEKPKTITFPAGTQVSPCFGIMQSFPCYWGKDSLEWRPERWLETEKLPNLTESFMPWISGNRVCPGRKFSQVEFVAVIGSLFYNHRVEVRTNPGETPKQAQIRAHNCLENVEYKPTKKMRIPESIALQWTKV